jgi:hypothetical protein
VAGHLTDNYSKPFAVRQTPIKPGDHHDSETIMIRFISYGITAAVAATLAAGGAVGLNHPAPVIHTVTVTNTVTVTPPSCLTAISLAAQTFRLSSDTLSQITTAESDIASYDFVGADAADAQIAADTAQVPVDAWKTAVADCTTASTPTTTTTN